MHANSEPKSVLPVKTIKNNKKVLRKISNATNNNYTNDTAINNNRVNKKKAKNKKNLDPDIDQPKEDFIASAKSKKQKQKVKKNRKKNENISNKTPETNNINKKKPVKNKNLSCSEDFVSDLTQSKNDFIVHAKLNSRNKKVNKNKKKQENIKNKTPQNDKKRKINENESIKNKRRKNQSCSEIPDTTNIDEDQSSEFSDIPEELIYDSENESEENYLLDKEYLWSDKIINYSLENFNGSSELNHDLCVGSTEQDYFELFITDEFINNIVTQTNLYATQYQSKKGKIDNKWYPTYAREIKAYIGILIYMGMVVLPEENMYFNEDFVECPLISKTMPYQRFRKISQYFHMNNDELMAPRDSVEFDVLHKVRPAVDVIKKFSVYYKPDRNLAVDEAMIKFKGRHYIKQYMPNKPDKWGIKVWCLCESQTGYLVTGNIYLGKKECLNKDYLLGEQVVLNLLKDYENMYHHVYFDNYFSSVRLLDLLLKKKVYACGTVRANRKGLPDFFKKPKLLKLEQGEFKQVQSEKITAVVWHDKRDVQVIFTNCNPLITNEISRRGPSGREKKMFLVHCP